MLQQVNTSLHLQSFTPRLELGQFIDFSLFIDNLLANKWSNKENAVELYKSEIAPQSSIVFPRIKLCF